MADFRAFVDDVKGLAVEIVRLIENDRDIVPMIHMRRGDKTDGFGVDPGFFDPNVEPRLLIENAVTPFVDILRPELVAWTFTGRRGRTEGWFEHEVAVVVVIDRERAEVWEARLVRHDGRASLGAWRPWPVDQATGRLIQPVQEVLR